MQNMPLVTPSTGSVLSTHDIREILWSEAAFQGKISFFLNNFANVASLYSAAELNKKYVRF